MANKDNWLLKKCSIASAYRRRLLDVGLPKFTPNFPVSAVLIQPPVAILRKSSV